MHKYEILFNGKRIGYEWADTEWEAVRTFADITVRDYRFEGRRVH